MSNVTRTPPQNTSIKSAFLNASSLGTTAIIAAAPGMSIRVISAAIVATVANGVTFQSAASAIGPLWPLGANGGVVLPFNEHGWVQTNVGEALNINMSVATPTGILINYIIL